MFQFQKQNGIENDLTQFDVFQIQKENGIEKDEAVVTSPFCRIF